MGLKELEREVREIGRKEINTISLESGREADRIEKEIEQKAASETRKLEERNRKEMELDRKRILAKASLQIKEQAEKKKDEIIEKAFEEAAGRILQMSSREKAGILKMLADEGKKGLESPTVFVDRKYARLLKGAKAKDIGDFGVRVTSGHISVDNTLSAKLEELKSGSRHKVAGVLWQS
jgi:vacuolar-type H+-ATPase subunit E/Vma4